MTDSVKSPNVPEVPDADTWNATTPDKRIVQLCRST